MNSHMRPKIPKKLLPGFITIIRTGLLLISRLNNYYKTKRQTKKRKNGQTGGRYFIRLSLRRSKKEKNITCFRSVSSLIWKLIFIKYWMAQLLYSSSPLYCNNRKNGPKLVSLALGGGGRGKYNLNFECQRSLKYFHKSKFLMGLCVTLRNFWKVDRTVSG